MPRFAMHAPVALPLFATLSRLVRPRPAPALPADAEGPAEPTPGGRLPAGTADAGGKVVTLPSGAGPAAIARARLGPGLPPGGGDRRASADPFVQRLARLH
jgi:hypothetical protein